MKVFTEDFIRDLKLKWDDPKKFNKPPIYWVATQEDAAELRTQIESWVGELPEKSQPRTIANLRSAYIQTFNELAVGNALKELGYKPIYEQEINDLTPDWYIPSGRDNNPFLVEVFTPNKSPERIAQNQFTEEIMARIRTIPFDIVLNVFYETSEIQYEAKDKKEVYLAVKNWLGNTPVEVNSQLVHRDFVFTVLQKDTKLPGIVLGSLPPFIQESKDSVIKNIKIKTKKYENLGLPIVVAVAENPITTIGFKELQEALFGDIRIFINRDSSGNAVSAPYAIHTGPNQFEKLPNLSAVIWVYRENKKTKIKPIFNEVAARPLIDNTFEQLAC